jgi:hypothetical protein
LINSLAPVLVVAPEVTFPTRSGGDISIERVARHLSTHAEFVDLVSCQSIRRYQNAEVKTETAYVNQLRGALPAALRTLLYRSHYLHERFHTPSALRAIGRQFHQETYGMVLASFLVTLAELPEADRFFTVWTHNDEFKWCENIASNPLTGLVGRQSASWLRRQVPILAKKAVFLHVTEKDSQAYEKHVPGHRHLITGIGTDLDECSQWEGTPSDGPVILSFVGSLGVKMARDALSHFQEQFEPKLRAEFGPRLRIRVVGSQPGKEVTKICQAPGWELHPDVTDHELARLMRQSTFTILPFAYSTGIKLKLFRSLGNGTPFLSTNIARPESFSVPPGCCFSDQPGDWVATVRSWLARTDQPALRQQLYTMAKSYSWPAIVENLVTALAPFQSALNRPPRQP